jgi:hypothetical protein
VVSAGNKVCIENWTRGHSCYVLAKTLSTFCAYPETLSEAELKSNGNFKIAYIQGSGIIISGCF